jgi:hypothetical protein
MGYTNRCQCLPGYNPPDGPRPCPDECLQAGSIIYPYEQGLGCGEDLVINLVTITNPGDCSCGVTFEATAVTQNGEALDIDLTGTTLTITNNLAEPTSEGLLFSVNYIMRCSCDARAILGTITIPITSVCIVP